MTNIFIARYTDKNGITQSVHFNRSKFTKKSASKWLNKNNIQNFMFFFEPVEPKNFGENGMIFGGEVGFDITPENLIPAIEQGKEIYLDTFGGNLWDSLKIHDAIKKLNTNPYIEVMGTCASAGMQILLATENRHMTENSRLLIHNPTTWADGDDEVFLKTAKDLETEKINIANIYAKVSGKPIDEILAIMKEERLMYLNEAIELNFVKTKEQININVKKEIMTDQETKELGIIKTMLNKITNLITPSKNVIVQDVNGVEIDFPELETAEQITVGSMATIDGGQANGDYVMEDGRTFVFENGAVMEIKEAEAVAEIEQEVAQDATLEAENETLRTEVKNMQKANDEMKAEFSNKLKEVNEKLESFQNSFSDEKAEITKPEETQESKKSVSFKIDFNK